MILSIAHGSQGNSGLSTVESVQNYLGVHEYQGHGILGYKSKMNNHWKCYQLQKLHKTFWKLTPSQQVEINKNLMDYKRKEFNR